MRQIRFKAEIVADYTGGDPDEVAGVIVDEINDVIRRAVETMPQLILDEEVIVEVSEEE
jgi:hypothetical protein